MPTNWHQLREFLLCQSRSGLLAQLTFNELGSFFRYADSGHYDLRQKQALDLAEVVRAISLATSDPVRRLELVSLDEPFPGAKSMIRQEYERHLQRQFCVTLIGPVSRLRVRHLQPLNQKLGNASWDSLRIHMDVCLLGQLRNALMARLMASIGVIIKDTFVGSNWEPIADGLAWPGRLTRC